MSQYIGRNFEEIKQELDENKISYSWEIAQNYSCAFDIDKDLYCLRELESSSGEKKLVLAYMAKSKPKEGNQ